MERARDTKPQALFKLAALSFLTHRLHIVLGCLVKKRGSAFNF